jgi:hypothetical protein
MPMATTERSERETISHDDPIAHLARLVRGEYLEMPGLSLTFRQAMRLWNLDHDRCRRVLEQLVRTGFLTESRHGLYRRIEGSA